LVGMGGGVVRGCWSGRWEGEELGFFCGRGGGVWGGEEGFGGGGGGGGWGVGGVVGVGGMGV